MSIAICKDIWTSMLLRFLKKRLRGKHLRVPTFLPSKTQNGLQISDAAAYCTLKKLNNYVKFEPYWNIIKNKLRKSSSGKVEGFGYKLFP